MTWGQRRVAERAKWLATSEHDMVAFLGPNSGAFRTAWERGRANVGDGGVGIVRGWSWPAFVFGFAWLLYRKQWVNGIFMLVVPIGIGALWPDRPGGILVIGVLFAMYGKSLVVQDGVTKIARIRARGGDSAGIAAAGGVSRVAGAIGGTIWVLAVIGAVLRALRTPGSA